MDMLHYFLDNFRLFHATGDVTIHHGTGDTREHLATSTRDSITIVKRVDDAFLAGTCDIDPREVTWQRWRGVSIPFLRAGDTGEESAGEEIISEEEGRVVIHQDIVFSAFYFLSGWNERARAGSGVTTRVPYAGSLVERLGIVHLPVVNYYFDILATALARLHVPSRERPWGGRSLALALTHDIDTCNRAWLEGSRDAARHGHPWHVPLLVARRLLGADAWFNFNTIMEIDERAGARSTFYFLPRRGKSDGRRNADYDVTGTRIRHVITDIRRRGHEVGLHGSPAASVDAAGFAIDARRVGLPLAGNRFHYLAFDPTRTPGVLASGGVKYDTTLGFAEHAGFRRGTCYPFLLFDFETGAATPVLEIPLAVMDATLRDGRYMGLAPREALACIDSLAGEVVRFGGVLALLWHNTFFSDYKYAGWREVYTRVLEHARDLDALLTNCQDVYERIIDK